MREIRKFHKAVLLGTLLQVCMVPYGCTPATQPDTPHRITQTSTPPSPIRSSVLTQSTASTGVAGEVIWAGEGNGIGIRWTTVDLYAQSASGTERIWEPLVRKGFEDFAALMEDNRPGEARRAERCSYKRQFRVLSIVGTLVSFEDQYSDDCGGAHPATDTRFTTIDLLKPGDVLYAREEETPMMNVDLARPGKIVKLTDYFAEKDILNGLLADPSIQKAVAALNRPTPPQTLTELPELFADNYYAVGDTDFELRPDFLTRFAFHHIEGDRVAVRIGLPPHSGANRTQHEQLGLLLPIPETLRRPLVLAVSRQQGFLMSDAARIAGNLTTTFNFRPGESIKTHN